MSIPYQSKPPIGRNSPVYHIGISESLTLWPLTIMLISPSPIQHINDDMMSRKWIKKKRQKIKRIVYLFHIRQQFINFFFNTLMNNCPSQPIKLLRQIPLDIKVIFIYSMTRLISQGRLQKWKPQNIWNGFFICCLKSSVSTGHKIFWIDMIWSQNWNVFEQRLNIKVK